MTKPTQLEQFRAAFLASTPEDWEVDTCGEPIIVNLGPGDEKFIIKAEHNGEANAQFISQAHKIAPGLIQAAVELDIVSGILESLLAFYGDQMTPHDLAGRTQALAAAKAVLKPLGE